MRKTNHVTPPLIWIFLASLTLVLPTAIMAATPAIDADFSVLDSVVLNELKEKKTPGAVIAIINGDRIVYQKAFGFANVETKEPMRSQMLFRLGSTTKMFTAAAILRLSETGRLNLTEPIGSHIKGLCPRIAETTADHLLSHSAGFRDFAAPFISNDDEALEKMVQSWKDDVFFANQGEIYSYSSPGYWLSGYLVEKLNGKPYADSMVELIFKPLGMDHTTLRPLMAVTYPFAIGHAIEKEQPIVLHPMFNNVAMWPAGSMFSNVEDLSKFVIAFMNDGQLQGQRALSSSLISRLSKPRVPVPGEVDSYYAYGLTTFKYQGLQFVGHGGFSRGYGSMIQMVPERRFAVIVLTNKSGETLRKSLDKALETGLQIKDADKPEKAPSFSRPTTHEFENYVGTYMHAPTTWKVSLTDGKLFVEVDAKRYELVKSGERKFKFGESEENELVFVPGKNGRIDFLFSELYAAKRIAATQD